MYKLDRFKAPEGARYPICEDCGEPITENRKLYDDYGNIYCMRCARKRFKYDLDDSLVGDSNDYIED